MEINKSSNEASSYDVFKSIFLLFWSHSGTPVHKEIATVFGLEILIRVGWKDTKMPISPKVTQNPVRLSMKNPKSHPLTFWSHPGGCWTLRLTGDGLSHLEVPWEWLFDLKLKIYVKIIHSEHFVFYEKNFIVSYFFDFI